MARDGWTKSIRGKHPGFVALRTPSTSSIPRRNKATLSWIWTNDPLLTAAESTAEEQSHRQCQEPHEVGVTRQDVALAEPSDPDTEPLRPASFAL